MLINTRIGMTPDEVKAKVESWNWNASIFEMYDEVKEMPRCYGKRVGSLFSFLLNCVNLRE